MSQVLPSLMLTSDLPEALRAYYSAELITTGQPNIVYRTIAAERKIGPGQNAGSTIVFTIYQNLPPSISPLNENIDVGTLSLASMQRAVTVQEYGASVGVSERLNLTSVHGPILDIVRTMLAPQMALTMDLLARNAIIQEAVWRSFAGGATSRAAIAANATLTPDMIRDFAFRLSTRQVAPYPNGYVAVIHPAQSYDIRSHPFWIDVNKYTRPETVLQGEIGSLFGVRFVESPLARLPNAGAQTAQTTLSGDVEPNRNYIVVANASGFSAGMEITIHQQAGAPNGFDPSEESLVIDRIDGNRLYLRARTTIPHRSGDFVTEGRDIYPVCFFGMTPALGYAVVLEPEVRVALPTDRLRRMSHVGWYGVFGFGLIRPWALEYVEVASSAVTVPAFPW